MDIFRTIITTEITWQTFLIICLSAYTLGVLLALSCKFRTHYSKSFLVTVSIIPSVVALIIIMVNGSLGAGIAIAGAFSLVRFRSAQGTAKEICAVFASTAIGIVLGMGYVAYAVIFTALTIGIIMLLSNTPLFGRDNEYKHLEITIPENLNYSEVFQEVFNKYTTKVNNIQIKLVNLGSMYKLKYKIKLKKDVFDKDFLDEIRCLNGNLDVLLTYDEMNRDEL